MGSLMFGVHLSSGKSIQFMLNKYYEIFCLRFGLIRARQKV